MRGKASATHNRYFEGDLAKSSGRRRAALLPASSATRGCNDARRACWGVARPKLRVSSKRVWVQQMACGGMRKGEGSNPTGRGQGAGAAFASGWEGRQRLPLVSRGNLARSEPCPAGVLRVALRVVLRVAWSLAARLQGRAWRRIASKQPGGTRGGRAKGIMGTWRGQGRVPWACGRRHRACRCGGSLGRRHTRGGACVRGDARVTWLPNAQPRGAARALACMWHRAMRGVLGRTCNAKPCIGVSHACARR